MGAPANSTLTRRQSRSWMCWGQFPKLCSTWNTKASLPSPIRPLTRLRRRVASSMPSSPRSSPGFSEASSASPGTGLASITRVCGSGELVKPCAPASSVTQGRSLSSRAAATRNGNAVWNARCSSGRYGRMTLRAQASISRTPRRSCTRCSPTWNGERFVMVSLVQAISSSRKIIQASATPNCEPKMSRTPEDDSTAVTLLAHSLVVAQSRASFLVISDHLADDRAACADEAGSGGPSRGRPPPWNG